MTRHLDLEKVKQAWSLRRQGKQQKEVADALGLSLRHIQNYLSVDWLAQRSLRALMKGGAEEVNEQLKALGGLGEAGPVGGGAQPVTRDQASCASPDQWPDVARLEGWGVPKYTAPGLLSAWRRAHREEAHELCDFWLDLTGNVQAEIPFPDAYDLAMARWLAHRWGVDFLSTITELYQLYRPWEGKVHRKVYLDEVRVAIGEGPGNYPSDQVGGLFEGLPRRFLHGLPRRFGQYGHLAKDDDDD